MAPYITTHIQVHGHPKRTATPTPSSQCLAHAMFMHNLPVGWAIFLALVFGIVAVVCTNAVRRWTPGVVVVVVVDEVGKPNGGPVTTSQAQAQVQSVEGERMSGGEDASPLIGGDAEDTDREGKDIPPPPYHGPAPAQAPAPTSTPPSTAAQTLPAEAVATTEVESSSWLTPKKPDIKYTSAHLFVIGTSFFLLTVTSLMLSALCIQAASLCDPDGEFGTLAKTVLWLLFSLPTGWATTALSCWLMLLRDLWGPKSRIRKLKIEQGSVAMGLIMVVIFPFTFVGYVVGGGMVKAVQWCQKWCCGVEDEVEGRQGEGQGVELEDGRGVEEEVGRESQDLSEVEGEERVALMGNGNGSGKGEV